MKYGLIVHFKTRNIGDDIQCYAMEKLLPHVDYLIDREHLDSFYTSTGERVATFLGGWYLLSPLNWPPSPFLKILPISFHLTNREGRGIFTLTDYGATWLKKISPIGCRDEGTAEFLGVHGVPAYVSGCCTLTIKPFADVEPHGKIVIVDCAKEVVAFVKKNTQKKVVTLSHRYADPKFPPEVVAYAEEHDAKDIIPTSHEPAQPDEPHDEVYYKGSWSYRRALMEGLLRFYQGASLVVTKRLHVALPCLAMGVPVLMINGEGKLLHYRFSTFTPYINHTTPKDFISDNPFDDAKTNAFTLDKLNLNEWSLNTPYPNDTTEDYTFLNIPLVNSITPNDLLSKKFSFDFDNPKPNPSGHEKFAKGIRAACEKFITTCENSDEPKLDVETWLDYHKRVLRLKQIMQKIVPSPYLTNIGLLNTDA